MCCLKNGVWRLAVFDTGLGKPMKTPIFGDVAECKVLFVRTMIVRYLVSLLYRTFALWISLTYGKFKGTLWAFV